MFNEDQKIRYINKKESEVTTAKGFLANLFSKTAPFEEMLQKDVCEWTVREIIEFYKYIDIYSYEYICLLNSNYGMYTNWCLTETLVRDGQNHFLEITADTMMSCINTSLLESMIISRDEMIDHVRSLPNYSDQILFYMLFEGMYGEQYKEILNAKFSDIDVTKKEIHLCTGRVIPVTDRLIDIARWASEESEYQFYRVQARKSTFSQKDVEDGVICKVITRSKTTDENRNKNQAQVLSRRFINGCEFAGFPNNMTPKKMIMSGKIELIKEYIRKTGLPAEEVLAKYAKEIDYRYPVEKIQSIVPFMRKYGVLLKVEETEGR